MGVGVVFASTGGHKLMRAIRSFRRAEPGLKVHVVLDVESKTWKSNSSTNEHLLWWLANQPDLVVHHYVDPTNHWINGTLDAAVRWIGSLGYTHACLFHDDIIFSPLKSNRWHVSVWFDRLEADPMLKESSGLSFSLMEAFALGTGAVEGQEGNWHRPPAEWDMMDLESDVIWSQLLPNGETVGYFGVDGNPVGRVGFPSWFIHCYVTPEIQKFTRLGPTGSIIPIKTYEDVGGFDQAEGMVYDMEYPVRCALKGLPPVYVIPNTPHLHLHNQSIGYADPAVDLWGNCLQSFIKHYGKDPSVIWAELGYKRL